MEDRPKEKLPYEEPKVIASYEKDELEEIIKPHGDLGGGCGSIGGGSW